MNLYIINEVLVDYTSGMVVIAAESKESAREFFLEKFGWSQCWIDDFDSKHTKFTVIEGVNHDAGIVDFVYGGA